MEIIAQERANLKTQADAVLYFLQRMDIDMVNDLLDDHRTYQDLEKSVFVRKFGLAIEQFRKAGDTFLDKYNGFCNSEECNFKCKGFTFIGNRSGRYMDLIIDIQSGEVQDIYECLMFKSSGPETEKISRIFLDDSRAPF